MMGHYTHIVKLGENVPRRLVCWRFGHDSNRKCGHTKTVKNDRHIVQISQYFDTKCIGHAVGNQDTQVDCNRLSWGRGIVIIDGGSGRD